MSYGRDGESYDGGVRNVGAVVQARTQRGGSPPRHLTFLATSGWAVHVAARKSQAKSAFSGRMQRVRKTGFEEAPDEICILLWLEMEPENFF